MTNTQTVTIDTHTTRRLLAVLLLALSLQFVAASCDSDDLDSAAADQYGRMHN